MNEPVISGETRTGQAFRQAFVQHRSFSVLQRFIRAKPPMERCDLCGAALIADHQHLVEVAVRKLICACDGCALLFPGQEKSKYRRVPRRILLLSDFQLSDAQWDELLIPINMAFFFQSTPAGKVLALYPSPAGPTESLLDLRAWNDVVQKNSILRRMEPDVEALLVNRVKRLDGDSRHDYYLVPIDWCYKLVGLIRAHWRGLSGGTEVWNEVEGFFADLRNRSSSLRMETRA